MNAHFTLLQELGPTGLNETSRDAFHGRLVAGAIEASLGRLDPEHRQRCWPVSSGEAACSDNAGIQATGVATAGPDG